jgi:hypothetical protein
MCGERIRSVNMLDTVLIRLVVVLLLALKLVDDLFATALTFVYKAGTLGAAEGLGQLTPGDDYNRLKPLMDAIPLWLHGLWVLAAGLYLTALVLFVLRKGPAYIFVLAALAIEILAQVLGRQLIAATGVVVNPHPSFLAAVVIPYFIPLALACVMWLAGRKRAPQGHQS